jgi:hypothetical protein
MGLYREGISSGNFLSGLPAGIATEALQNLVKQMFAHLGRCFAHD